MELIARGADGDAALTEVAMVRSRVSAIERKIQQEFGAPGSEGFTTVTRKRGLRSPTSPNSTTAENLQRAKFQAGREAAKIPVGIKTVNLEDDDRTTMDEEMMHSPQRRDIDSVMAEDPEDEDDPMPAGANLEESGATAESLLAGTRQTTREKAHELLMMYSAGSPEQQAAIWRNVEHMILLDAEVRALQAKPLPRNSYAGAAERGAGTVAAQQQQTPHPAPHKHRIPRTPAEVRRRVAKEPQGIREKYALLCAQGKNPYTGGRLNAPLAVQRATVEQPEMKYDGFRQRVEALETRYFSGVTRVRKGDLRKDLTLAMGEAVVRGIRDINFIGRSMAEFTMTKEVADTVTEHYATAGIKLVEGFDLLSPEHLKRPDIAPEEKAAKARSIAMERFARVIAETRDAALVNYTLCRAEEAGLSEEERQRIILRGRELATAKTPKAAGRKTQPQAVGRNE
jgi:hypothetical protein